MPRRPNTRPTNIYWLLDTRPEMLLVWPDGKPFYCGKTIFKPEKRLADHRGRDSRRHPHRPIAVRLKECDGQVRVILKEVVPVNVDWQERERQWVAKLRAEFPDCVNVANGGEGGAGCIPSEETRRKRSESLLRSAAKRADTLRRRGVPTGQVHSEATRQKLRNAHIGMKASDATRAKMRKSAKRRPPPSQESIRKVAEAHCGMKRSAESRKRISEACKAAHARKRAARS